VSTGSTALDWLLTGPGFLDAGVFPEISFRSEQLACVPAGWRAIGQLQVKGTEHALACQLEVVQAPGRHRRLGTPLRLTIASGWVLDSRWVTSQWIPALSRHIAMTCSAALEPAM
jgi:polyisoprenoid-binding protein YceI